MVRKRRRPLIFSTPLPSDDELVAFVTSPMSSLDVAEHFHAPGPRCLKRMRYLADQGRLSRPWTGVYAPAAMADIPRPLRPRLVQVLAFLDEPRTMAEIEASLGITYSGHSLIAPLFYDGRIAHCGRWHYVRADLVGQFGARERKKFTNNPTPQGKMLREEIMALMTEPRGSEDVTSMLGVERYRVNYMLTRMVREGQLTRTARPGANNRYFYHRADLD